MIPQMRKVLSDLVPCGQNKTVPPYVNGISVLVKLVAFVGTAVLSERFVSCLSCCSVRVCRLVLRLLSSLVRVLICCCKLFVEALELSDRIKIDWTVICSGNWLVPFFLFQSKTCRIRAWLNR